MNDRIGGGETLPATAKSSAPSVSRSPKLADGIQLLGEMKGSGYREPPALVRRADGQVLQLTPLLYELLASVDGSRSIPELASHLAASTGRQLSSTDVAELITGKLLPLGLLELADGSQPAVKRGNPLLRMRLRFSVSNPATTQRLARPFAALFSPVLVAVVLLIFALVTWWVLFDKGLASATHGAFENPGLLLAIFAISLVSAGFHEFGHAAGATRGGAIPGTMGAGLYLVWPAFFTDVTDSYRLGRGGRLRTDLGGLYFNAIVVVLIAGAWWLSRNDAILLVIAAQLVMMVQQLTPIVRFDGYHVLADLTGVPDLFQRIKPTLLGLLPWRWGRAENSVLKPWARAIITVWVLAVVPLLVGTIVVLVVSLPRILATAWESSTDQAARVAVQWSETDFAGAAASALAVLAVALPVAGIIYLLVRMGRQVSVAAWRSTEGKPVARALAAVVAIAVVGGLAFAWWPSTDRYRPVEAWEAGTVQSAIAAPAASALPREGATGSTVTVWPDDDMPTRDEPKLATVLVPRDPTQPSWVFPFDRPDVPEGDDNQALAVNTADGTIVYDVAFALVWADAGQTVDTTNEAIALASCTVCAAVAVSFQVVLIVGQADVIVPQNLATAANYNCVRCVTAALANQLVVTLDGPLSDAGLEQLNALWARIAEFSETIPSRSLAEIEAQLEQFKSEILAIITDDAGGASSTPAPESTVTPTEAPVDPGTDPEPSTDDPELAPDDEEEAPTENEQPEPEPTTEPTPPPAPEETPAP